MLINEESRPKIDRRVLRTKTAIATSFLELMNQKNISKITIKELCDLADINRKTFYAYYQSVYDVLSEIENGVTEDFEASISAMKKSKSKVCVSDIFMCVVDLLNENTDFMKQLLQVDELYGLEKKIEWILKKNILESLSEIKDKDNEIYDISMNYIISGAFAMYIEWFYADSKIPHERLSKLLVEFVNSNIESMLRFANPAH